MCLIHESSNVMALFSAFGRDFPTIALIVSPRTVSMFFSDVRFICCRAGEVGSLDLRLSRALILSHISTGTGSVLIRCRPEGICCDAAFRMTVRKIFSHFWQFVGSRLFSVCPFISLRYRSQFAIRKLKRVRLDIGLIVHLQTNEDL